MNMLGNKKTTKALALYCDSLNELRNRTMPSPRARVMIAKMFHRGNITLADTNYTIVVNYKVLENNFTNIEKFFKVEYPYSQCIRWSDVAKFLRYIAKHNKYPRHNSLIYTS